MKALLRSVSHACRTSDCAVLDQPYKIYRVSGHILDGLHTGTVFGTVFDIHKLQVTINSSALSYLALDGTSFLFRRP